MEDLWAFCRNPVYPASRKPSEVIDIDLDIDRDI